MDEMDPFEIHWPAKIVRSDVHCASVLYNTGTVDANIAEKGVKSKYNDAIRDSDELLAV